MQEDAIPEEAVRLHEEGRAAGAAGDAAGALERFLRARELAPAWPYPPYDIAFTYLLDGNLAAAEQWYAHVDTLAPRGFFTAKTSLDLVRRELRGELPEGFTAHFTRLEWETEETRFGAYAKITEELPELGAGWKAFASVLEGNARLVALDRGLACDCDDETYGMLVLNKALALRERGDAAGAARLLDELLASPRCTAAAEALARHAR